MLGDLPVIATWWIYLFGLGLFFLPLTRKIFRPFFDQGYLFSKVLGIAISAYLVWLLASLKILPFFRESILLVLTIGLVANLWLATRDKTKPSPWKDKQFWTILIGEELLFFLGLTAWSWVRGFQPDIQGLEKFMDFGFVNSILRSKYFPPADMWFAGKYINYYYFGHFVTAFLTRLSGINSASTYNLMLGTLFAFTFTLAFSLAGNLVYLWQKARNLLINKKLILDAASKRAIIMAGLMAGLLISLGANLHPAFYNFKMNILKKPYCDGAFTYWYPNATRYIGYCPSVEDKTIHEFPSYSFVVSDLHGHVSDIPFVLTFLALVLCLFLTLQETSESQEISFFGLVSINLPIKALPVSLLLSLLLAIMYMTNQWDYPIYLLILGLILLWSFYRQFGFTQKAFVRAVSLGLPIVLLSVPLFLVFQLNFENIAKGIDLVRAHSLFYQLLILWGAPWFFGLTFCLFLYARKFRFSFKKENFVKFFSRVLGVEIEVKKQPNTPSFQTPFLSDYFVLVMFLVSTFLIFIPEVIYVKDIYIPSYHRANTMFKLTYQSFMMFSIVSGYIIVRLLSSLRRGVLKKLLYLLYCLLFASLMVYPHYAVKGYYGELKSANYKGIYGLQFLQRLYPDDYQAILWLNQNIKGQPVVLEAVGDSYTDYERISMSTGLPTIEGWLVHEWLWRGSYDEPGKRASEVQTIYETKDPNEARAILQKYQVKFLVIGEMERQKYPKLEEKKFTSLGKTVFESGKTKILELL